MQIKSARTIKGKKQVIVLLDSDEKLLVVKDDAFYRLGYPHEDVLPAHIVADATRVTWCHVEQRWVA